MCSSGARFRRERRLHVGSRRVSLCCRSAILVGVTVAAVLGTAVGVMAQALKDLQTSDAPLVLKAQGSFFIGGEKADETDVQLGNLGPAGHIAINQMYVRYMVPQARDGNVPVMLMLTRRTAASTATVPRSCRPGTTSTLPTSSSHSST